MLNFLDNNNVVLLIGRIFLALIYLIGGLTWLFTLNPPIGYIAAKGFPAPALLGWIALIFKLGGAVLVTLGYKTRLGAVMLVLFTLVTAFGFHPPWFEGEYTTFMKELAMIGGLLVLAAVGPGAISLDAKR
ncbi:MAG TPA: DoxX family protein [Burkholderiales bacterium]